MSTMSAVDFHTAILDTSAPHSLPSTDSTRRRSSSIHSQDVELTSLSFFPLGISSSSPVSPTPSDSNSSSNTPAPANHAPFSPTRTLQIRTAKSTTAKSKIVVRDDEDVVVYTMRRFKSRRWEAEDTLTRHIHHGPASTQKAAEEVPVISTKYRFLKSRKPVLTILPPPVKGDGGASETGRGSPESSIPTITLTSDEDDEEHLSSPSSDDVHSHLRDPTTHTKAPHDPKKRDSISLHPGLLNRKTTFTLSTGLHLTWEIEATEHETGAKVQSLALWAEVSHSPAQACTHSSGSSANRTKIARLVSRGAKGVLALELGSEVHVRGEMGVDGRGHLVRGVVEEGMVVASGLGVARRVGWMS